MLFANSRLNDNELKVIAPLPIGEGDEVDLKEPAIITGSVTSRRKRPVKGTWMLVLFLRKPLLESSVNEVRLGSCRHPPMASNVRFPPKAGVRPRRICTPQA